MEIRIPGTTGTERAPPALWWLFHLEGPCSHLSQCYSEIHADATDVARDHEKTDLPWIDLLF